MKPKKTQHVIGVCDSCNSIIDTLTRCCVCGSAICPRCERTCYSCEQTVCATCADLVREETGETLITACTVACVENFRADNREKLAESHRRVALMLRKNGIVKPVFQGRFFAGLN